MPSPSDLTPELASSFARIALGHVTQEFPNKLDHVLAGPEDARGPRDLHPIYFGSFDWHSCVHGYWTLATVRRLHPGIPEAAAIDALFAQTFTAEKVAGELAYLARPGARGFERPYGWAWLLKLQAELLLHDSPHAAVHQPLADAFVARFIDYLPRATYPVRSGMHNSSAFALSLAHDYGTVTKDAAFDEVLHAAAEAWYAEDRAAQAWEPNAADFLSATLMEALLMRQLRNRESFRSWFAEFLPEAALRRPATLFTPATVSDRTDGQIVHLDGLNLSRAWCWRHIAAALAQDDPVHAVALEAADAHLAASLPHVSGHYMGEHWLASFALLALTA